MYIIRKRIKLKPEESIYIFTDDKLIPSSMILSTVYEKNKNEDGFLYMVYTAENTFG